MAGEPVLITNRTAFMNSKWLFYPIFLDPFCFPLFLVENLQ